MSAPAEEVPTYAESPLEIQRAVYHALRHLSEGHVLFAVLEPKADGQCSPTVLSVIARMGLPVRYDPKYDCVRVDPGRREELTAWIYSQPL